MDNINVLPFIPSDPNYSFSTTLNDEVYGFDVHWNNRDSIDPTTGVARGAWYFDMYDANDEPIIMNVKIVLGTYLGRQSAHPFFTNNTLAAVSLTLDNTDPGYDDLGVRVIVQHYTKLALANELSVL